MSHIVSYNSILHAQIQGQGVWKLDGTVNSIIKASHILGTYPNPTQGIIHLKTRLDKLTILNTLGEVVLKIDQPSQSINASDLPQGIYYLSGFQSETHYQTKFIKL